MRSSRAVVSSLLFCSGACALIYQTVWLRQFRLVFGASTAATAAVLAIFMGGLGVGSAILGKRADAHPNPIRFYAGLELLITASAILSPFLLAIVRAVYIGLGGSTTLGSAGATIARLLLSSIVLAVPTFLMGGTLPAAARAIERIGDQRRTGVASLYAANTFGAVVGTTVSTFFLLELLGNRLTLFAAALLNLGVALTARYLIVPAEPASETAPSDAPEESAGDTRRAAPLWFVLGAAAVTGFAFLLMELVWYRMLGPILGGTTFMFGLILAMALLGIGAGGAVYAFGGIRHRPTAGGFAVTCAAEAALLILPYAAGDRLALVANSLRSLGVLGFGAHVLGWVAITMFVVFPVAFVSGIQFPLLIGLLGRGRDNVGEDVGMAYAFNTMGAICGSLAGGFGLIPLLSAPACWILVSFLLIATATAGAVIGVRERQLGTLPAAALLALIAVVSTTALGPTAVWRHSGIGAGRGPRIKAGGNIREIENTLRRQAIWSADGLESSIAIRATNDASFVVNGKTDGSARVDAGTQVMGGMVAATIHPRPRRALVIGLGTGSTAGWLANIPEMERVDVVELEPLVLGVAREFAAVNKDVLRNPKVHVHIGDAREVLLVSRAKYDIIFSEPSNPYRAGIASLFTREFYNAAKNRLAPGGLFVQWVQAYEVDDPTIATIYATLDRAFPSIETWRAATGDLLLVCAAHPISYDADMIRARVATPAFGEPLHVAWRAEGAEGFFSHYIARDTLAKAIARKTPMINTDDLPRIEFGFARAVGRETLFDTDTLIALAQKRGEWRPQRIRGAVDWRLAMLHRASTSQVTTPPPFAIPEYKAHHQFAMAYEGQAVIAARGVWDATHFTPVNSHEMAALADVSADEGREIAAVLAQDLRPLRAAEADAIVGRLRRRQGRTAEAQALLMRSLAEYHRDPWSERDVMGRMLDAVANMTAGNRAVAQQFLPLLEQPFATYQWEDSRRYYRIAVAADADRCGPGVMRALADVEPWPFWREDILRMRVECYGRRSMADDLEGAQEDLQAFQATLPRTFAP